MFDRQRLRQRIRVFRRYLKRPADITPLFVLSMPRAGSNMLLDYLRCFPEIEVRGEVLNPNVTEGIRDRWVSTAGVLRHVRRYVYGVKPGKAGRRLSTVKIHLPQLEARGMTVDDLRAAFPTARYIILFRESLGDAFVSRLRAFRTGQWLVREGQQRVEATVRVERPDLLAYLEAMRASYAALAARQWLTECSVHVGYETLAREPQKVLDETICPFLGVRPVPVRTTLQKQNTRPLEQVVENYDEVRDLLVGPSARLGYGA